MVWEVVPKPTQKSVMTIAPVARYSTFRTIISLVALFEWKLHQTDVKTVLLNGKIEENYLKFQMFQRTVKVHQKNYLKFLLIKGDQLGTKKWFKKARSIKLLLGLSKKDHKSSQVL